MTNPDFGSPAYWRHVAEGRIAWSDAESSHQDHEARRNRARQALQEGARTANRRKSRPEPDQSRQWAREMSTRAFRDDRLTMGAKALLTIIVAECGDHGRRMLAKAYLARRIHRSARTVQRYLGQLRRLGYIATDTVRNRAGWTIGQRIGAAALALPFWHPMNRRRIVDVQGETLPSPTKAVGYKTNTFSLDSMLANPTPRPIGHHMPWASRLNALPG